MSKAKEGFPPDIASLGSDPEGGSVLAIELFGCQMDVIKALL